MYDTLHLVQLLGNDLVSLLFRETLQDAEATVLNSFSAAPWRESLLVMAVVFVGVSLVINARRRTSKVKL